MGEKNIRFKLCRICWPAALVYLLFWAFCIWMTYRIPYTHDDWDWGLAVGMEQLLTANLNSRYSGNLLVVLLTRSAFLKTLVMGSTLFLIPMLWMRLATGSHSRNENPCTRIALFAGGAALLLSVNVAGWCETIGWVSGFSNFVFSGLMLGLFLLFSESVFDGSAAKSCGWLKALGLLLFTVALQLFLENITVYLVCVCFFFFVVDWVRNRHPSLRFGAILLGSVLGAVIMFSSQMYETLLSTGMAVGNYRKLTISFSAGLSSALKEIVKRFIFQIAPGIWEKNYLLVILILSALLWLTVIKFRTMPVAVSLGISVIELVAIVFFAFLWKGWEPALKINHIFRYHILINVGCFLFVALAVLLLFKTEHYKQFKLLGLWCSAPLVLLPIVAIELIGYRLYFTSNFFLILFLLTVLYECLTNSKPLMPLILALSGVVILFFVCSYWAVIYSAIGAVYAQQLSLIAQYGQSGQELVLPRFPFDKYLLGAYPGNEQRMNFYKEFFGIAEETTVIFRN